MHAACSSFEAGQGHPESAKMRSMARNGIAGTRTRMEKYATLRVHERSEAVLLVTLDRPEVANAFNTQAALELCDFFSRLGAGQRCPCVVMTGAGDKAFCAGADLKERNALSDAQWRSQHEIFER